MQPGPGRDARNFVNGFFAKSHPMLGSIAALFDPRQ
jgi:hypothetical protein